MIKNIVVPIDFSDASLNALKYAVQFALEMASLPKFTILNAYSIPLAYSDLDITFGPSVEIDQVENLIDKEFKKLHKLVPVLAEIKYETIKINQELPYAIEHFQEDQPIDLLFMGVSGKSGLIEKILGSNTVKVIKANIAPVMVIPKNALYKSIQNIAFSNDYKGMLPEAINPLKEIQLLYDAIIHVVHIDEESILALKESAEAKNLDLLLKGTTHKFHFMKEKEVEIGLNHFLEQEMIDLLVVLPRKKGFFETLFTKSESKKLVLHSKLPLLALKN